MQPGSASPDVNLHYGYDLLGRLASVTNYSLPDPNQAGEGGGGGQESQQQSQQQPEDSPNPNVTRYYYDLVGNLDHFTYPNGLKHTYTYTEQNRLQLLTLSHGNGALVRSFCYQLGPNGNRIAVAETNLSGSTLAQYRRVTYDYDQSYANPPVALPRVTRLTHETIFGGDNTSHGSETHAYDAVGNRLSRTSSFTFAPVDNLADQSFTFDNKDQLADHSGSYDSNGNTLKDENGNATGDFYDAENHLIRHGAATTFVMGYDFEGNRAWKNAGSVTTTYLLDDKSPSGYIQVIAEYRTTNSQPTALDRTYAYGHELINQTRYPTTNALLTTSYYGFDGHGSVRLLTDSTTSASTTDTYDYDAYGNLLSSSGTTPNHYRYTGQHFDEDLKMYYLRARYFLPLLGRLLSTDSFEGTEQDPRSLHKYCYVMDNPINGIDPNGHEYTAVSIGSTVTIMLMAEVMHLYGASNAARKAQMITASVNPDFNDLIWGLEATDITMDKVQLAMAFYGLTCATVKVGTFLAENSYKFENTVVRTLTELRLFASNPNAYRTYKEVLASLQEAGLTAEIHSHHYLQRFLLANSG